MTTQLEQAARLALEALEYLLPDTPDQRMKKDNAITALRAALGQEEYPEGDVVGPCICGSWPGGKCLKCPRIEQPAQDEDVDLEGLETRRLYVSPQQPAQVAPMSEPNRVIAYAASDKLHELGYRWLDGKWEQPAQQEPVVRWICKGCGHEYMEAPSSCDCMESTEYERIEYYTRPQAQPAQDDPVAWRNAAIRVGEDLCSVGPFGYYDMTAEQWLNWALSVVTVHAPPQAREPQYWQDIECPNCGDLARAAPVLQPLTDEQIDNATRKQADDLLDHIYEYGTAAEGVTECIRAISRAAIEAAHGIKGGSMKCIVKDCKNHEHEGRFIGSLCSPCHTYITKGEGTYSQAYRNSQREWVGMTLEDKKRILDNDFGGSRLDCMDAAEKILREKNT